MRAEPRENEMYVRLGKDWQLLLNGTQNTEFDT